MLPLWTVVFTAQGTLLSLCMWFTPRLMTSSFLHHPCDRSCSQPGAPTVCAGLDGRQKLSHCGLLLCLKRHAKCTPSRMVYEMKPPVNQGRYSTAPLLQNEPPVRRKQGARQPGLPGSAEVLHQLDPFSPDSWFCTCVPGNTAWTSL